jgi:uncharacterized protein (TIGR03437 family)
MPAGMHYVAAIGMNPDGSLQVHDPKPEFGRRNLNDYISGFDTGTDKWAGTVSAIVRFVPGGSTNRAFLVSSLVESISVTSRSGPCGQALVLPGITTGTFRLLSCDGAADEYQIELGGTGTLGATVTDLVVGGARVEISGGINSAAFRAFRPGPWLVVGPQKTTVALQGIVNAATFTPDIAPGGLITIFGTGLSRTGSSTKVEIGGRSLTVFAAFPFQVNAVVPAELAPGTHLAKIETSYGIAEQALNVGLVAPAVFSVDSGHAAVTNQDGRLNSPLVPARRGTTVVIYGTGLGATRTNSGISVTLIPVEASILGQDLPVAYAGLTPGFIGLYQINVSIPLSTPAGTAVPLVIRQGGVETRPVEIAIQ